MKYLLWPFLRAAALVLLAVVTVSGLLIGCREQQPVLPLAREMALDSDEAFLSSHHLHVSESDESGRRNGQLSRCVVLLWEYSPSPSSSQIYRWGYYSHILQVIEVYETEELARQKYAGIDWDHFRKWWQPREAETLDLPIVDNESKGWWTGDSGFEPTLGDHIVVFRKGSVVEQLQIGVDWFDIVEELKIMGAEPIYYNQRWIALSKVAAVVEVAEAKIPHH